MSFSIVNYKMPPITGRAMFNGPPIHEFIAPGFGTEVIYSLVIIVCSLMIYFGTKELYELSSHKGIKYLRKSFLFFAIAYFFRSFIKFLLFYFTTNRILDISPRIIAPMFGKATLFIFMYFSSMAIFYLLYSTMWKNWKNNPKRIYLFHLIALALSFGVILSRSRGFYLIANIILFLVVLSSVYISFKNSKKRAKKHKYNFYIIYVLLSLFWILNILDILVPEFFQAIQLIIYIISIVLFLIMLYKVLKKAGSD